MRKARLLFALAAAALLVVAVLVWRLHTGRYDAYLEGLWAGDPTFLSGAALNDLQLYIGPNENGVRQGYLILVDTAGNFVSNQALKLQGGRWRGALKLKAPDAARANIGLTFDAAAPMPEALTATLSMADGSLTLHDDQKVYAFMWKDHAASSAAAELKE